MMFTKKEFVFPVTELGIENMGDHHQITVSMKYGGMVMFIEKGAWGLPGKDEAKEWHSLWGKSLKITLEVVE